MKKDISYQPLIAKWEHFLTETNNDSLEHFAIWLLNDRKIARDFAEEKTEIDAYFIEKNKEVNLGYKSGEAAYLISRLNKFIRFYTKPIFREVGLSSSDEFAILAQLDVRQIGTKKQIIMDNIIEMTTGIDMIKRLIRQGWIAEKANDADKRKKLISLTVAGKTLLYTVYQKFATIQDVLVDLSKNERDALIRVAKSLDTFHTQNFISIMERQK